MLPKTRISMAYPPIIISFEGSLRLYVDSLSISRSFYRFFLGPSEILSPVWLTSKKEKEMHYPKKIRRRPRPWGTTRRWDLLLHKSFHLKMYNVILYKSCITSLNFWRHELFCVLRIRPPVIWSYFYFWQINKFLTGVKYL